MSSLRTPKIHMEPDRLSVHVDFDSTLFNTRGFASDLYDYMAKRLSKPASELQAQATNFYVGHTLKSFDFEGYVKFYGLDPKEMLQQVSTLIQANPTGYLYEDSPTFIQKLRREGYDSNILSFGEDRFQRAKITPVLSRLLGVTDTQTQDFKPITVEVILEPKGQYITTKYPGIKGVLVDDIPDQNLPSGFIEIHLNRVSDLVKPLAKSGGFTVSNLDQAYQAIREISTANG